MGKTFEILLIEDNPADVRLLKEALAESKVRHRLRVATDGNEAIEMLSQCDGDGRPDLVILDLNLPGRNGHEVLQFIRKSPAIQAVPVIVMSSSHAASDVNRAYEFHANCYVAKPTTLEDLFRVVLAIEQFWFEVVELPSR